MDKFAVLLGIQVFEQLDYSQYSKNELLHMQRLAYSIKNQIDAYFDGVESIQAPK